MEVQPLNLCLVLAPLPVRNVILSSHGSPSILLAYWNEPPGGKEGYQLVLYQIDSQSPVRNVTIPKGVTAFHFEKLLAGREYALRITTLAGESVASTSVRQWTGMRKVVFPVTVRG